jgi:nitrogen fixation protein NifB
MDQRGPTAEELQDLQDACSGDMNMMRHCRQCRADAVGLLGEDRGAEFTLDKIEEMNIDYDKAMVMRAAVREGITAELDAKRAEKAAKAATAAPVEKKGLRAVKMAIATSGGGVINQHFGHAKEFLVYEASEDGVRFVTHRKTDLYCSGDETCGDGESVLAKTIKALADCEVVLCSKIGYEPWGMLEEAGIAPNGEHGMEAIEDAVLAVYAEMEAAGKLAPKADGAACAA